MQKASVGFERAKEVEKELKKEQRKAERAEKDYAAQSQLMEEARIEVEMLKRENADLKKKSEEVEGDLRQQLATALVMAEKEYDRAVLVITDNYRAQMPMVKDAVWEAAWRRCLTKLEIDGSSPHWTDMELPSGATTSQPPSDPEPQPNSLSEQNQTDDTTADLISDDAAAEGNVPDPNSATDATPAQ